MFKLYATGDKSKGKKRMIITISGPIGSGKTTIARALSERFKLNHISAGQVFRDMAEEHKMNLQKFSKLAEKNPEIDREVDRRQVALAKDGNVIVDGRLSAHLIKDADFKIWLKANIEERARRVSRRENIAYNVALKETLERENSERKRYREIYNIYIDNLEPYDVILNTELWDVESIIKVIINMVTSSKMWMKPRREARQTEKE